METMETAAAAAATAALPNDLLAVVLGRLPARSLVASRGVCKAWRDLIDERQLLARLRRLLPHSVRGLFINYGSYGGPHFFSRPTSSSSAPAIHGKFEYPGSWYQVVDHCNGLVLFVEGYGRVLHVCNPTTRWSATLPRWPGGGTCEYNTMVLRRRAFLVFDPFVSPEYKVLLSPHPHESGRRRQVREDDACYLMEWPPSPWESWCEFSSTTGRWEEKAFVRDGEAAGTAGELLRLNKIQWGTPEPHWRYGAYWQGALYVHCHGEYVSRFSLLDDKYRVIKSPIQHADRMNDGVWSFLGRSKKGVYIAEISTVDLPKLRVWTLTESGDQMEWVPKDQSNLKINTFPWWLEEKKLDKMKYWILELSKNGVKNQVSLDQNVCWNSDDDNVMDLLDEEKEGWKYIKFLGFHPYKEVIFLYTGGYVVAFHLNSPKVQYLGSVDLPDPHRPSVHESFVYTPCLIGD